MESKKCGGPCGKVKKLSEFSLKKPKHANPYYCKCCKVCLADAKRKSEQKKRETIDGFNETMGRYQSMPMPLLVEG